MPAIREQIIDALEAALGGTDEYIRESVLLNYNSAAEEGYVAALIAGDERYEKDAYQRLSAVMTVEIERIDVIDNNDDWRARARAVSKASENSLAQIRTDIAGIDRTLGGLVSNLTEISGGPARPDPAGRVVGAVLVIEIRYNALIANPSLQ